MFQIPALIWLLLGFLFVLVEIFTPTFVFVFFGTSALAVGVAVAMGLPHTYGLPFLLFAALTVGQIYFLRTAFKPGPGDTPPRSSSRRGVSFPSTR